LEQERKCELRREVEKKRKNTSSRKVIDNKPAILAANLRMQSKFPRNESKSIFRGLLQESTVHNHRVAHVSENLMKPTISKLRAVETKRAQESKRISRTMQSQQMSTVRHNQQIPELTCVKYSSETIQLANLSQWKNSPS
jgi:hypothetical protein